MKFKNLLLKLKDGVTVDICGNVAILEMQDLKISIEGDYCTIDSDLRLEETKTNLDTFIEIIEDYTE